jgi:hypothetical protein
MSGNPCAKFVDGLDAAGLVKEFPGKLKAVLDRLGPEGMTRRLAPGKWSVGEILCHLADCEIAFSYRWRQTLAMAHHVIQPFDQDLWAPRYSTTSGQEALETFLALRQWNVTLLERVKPEDWERTVTHPERGDLTLRTLVEMTAGHDLNHLAQLETLAGVSTPSRNGTEGIAREDRARK